MSHKPWSDSQHTHCLDIQLPSSWTTNNFSQNHRQSQWIWSLYRFSHLELCREIWEKGRQIRSKGCFEEKCLCDVFLPLEQRHKRALDPDYQKFSGRINARMWSFLLVWSLCVLCKWEKAEIQLLLWLVNLHSVHTYQFLKLLMFEAP